MTGTMGAAEAAPYLGYIRVSTGEQVTSGYGLDAQEAAIRADAERRGWALGGIIRDEGATGATLDRPGLTEALDQLARGEAAGLIVSRLDRLSRSVVDFGCLLEWFDAAGVTLVALDLGVDTSTPGGRLVANVFASVAEWERATIAARTKAGLAAVRARGRPISRPSVADRPELRERIAAMRAAGKTLQAIADTLNTERVPTLRGGSHWRPSSVRTAAGWQRRKPRRQAPNLPPIRRAA